VYQKALARIEEIAAIELIGNGEATPGDTINNNKIRREQNDADN